MLLQTIILTVVFATAYAAASNSTSSTMMETIVTTVASIIGAAVVVGLINQQQSISDSSSSSSRQRKSKRDDSSSSDDISVEGSVMVTLPAWALASWEDYFTRKYTTDEEMMSLAIHLSDRNITEGTGGPFGAAIFERHADKHATLVSIGMNRVVPLGNSTLHGETVAIQLAQRRLGSFTLMLDENKEDGLFYDESHDDDEKESSTPRKRQFELFTSCEPCAMCLGATLWSGVSRIVCAATKDDAQSIGFDEGPVFEQSYEHLEKAGIQVTRNILREDAAKILQRYGTSGRIYNRG
mmetsp:Transcript_13438/g.22901  ORF Transcript_13438/g.22901 Transcript_13438/m.22901 type:complete len:296 (+) Transcript_13438:173-1060(+)